MTDTQSLTETQVRRLARKNGYMVRKSRARTINADDFGEYMLVDARLNTVVLGARFDASLKEISGWLQD